MDSRHAFSVASYYELLIRELSLLLTFRVLIEQRYTEHLAVADYTQQSVEEISELLGFSDPAYFSRFFKQMVGMTAGAFRQQGNVS